MHPARVEENEGTSALVPVGESDTATRVDALSLIAQCFASRRWTNELVTGRPYGSLRQMITASEDVLADLSWCDVAEGLPALPVQPHATPAERDVVRRELVETVRLRLIRTLR